jgi:hypothetical protein
MEENKENTLTNKENTPTNEENTKPTYRDYIFYLRYKYCGGLCACCYIC